tara:strand:+ start:488 stop:1081 length:594 start_codon:yes stop_codon:yes gene_type:complete
MSIYKFQSLWRGYKIRKLLKETTDNYTLKILNECINKYICDIQFNKKINSLLSNKKRRNENFPSDISENIVKFVIFKKYNIMPSWDTKKGDIIIYKMGLFKQIEIKGFMSDGPSSFGPNENWDILYFVDAKDFINKNFKVYEIKLSNKSSIFKNIQISKKETFYDIISSKRRPRGSFENIFKKQLKEYCKLIFSGNI